MTTLPSLTYHQKVFDLLQRTPTFDPTAEAKLRAVEEAYGLVLPPSVREWYSLNEAMPILREFEDNIYAVTLEEMVEYSRRWLANKCPYEERIIPEYQHSTILLGWDKGAGISVDAIAIDGSDDPPIIVHIEYDNDWQKYFNTFSIFTLNWVYDCLFNYKSKGCYVRSYNTFVSEDDYQILKQHFTEHTPIPPIRIFKNDDQLIYIWHKIDGSTDWWLHTNKPQSFRDLLQRLWSIGNLATLCTHTVVLIENARPFLRNFAPEKFVTFQIMNHKF